MINNSKENEIFVRDNIMKLYNMDLMPKDHVNFLHFMKNSMKIEPDVIYDIGSAVLHWSKNAEKIWTNKKIYLFDAFVPLSYLYDQLDYEYNIDVLSDSDDKVVKWFQNDIYFAGNSYYRELSNNNGAYFPTENIINKETRSLDSIVKSRSFKYPDLIKIDVQGCELDVLNGAGECLTHAKYLIIELQNKQYNEGAPLCDTVIKYLENKGWKLIINFCKNPSGYDGDYLFIKD